MKLRCMLREGGLDHAANALWLGIKREEERREEGVPLCHFSLLAGLEEEGRECVWRECVWRKWREWRECKEFPE